jgi:hypothetical protein
MPATSIKQAKEETIQNFLKGMLGGAFTKADIVDFDNIPAISKYLISAAEVFLYTAQDELNKQGRVVSGNLISQLGVSEVSQNGDVYSISVGYPKGSEAEKYYDYVNKGVKGFVSDQPADSPYEFRSPWANRAMASAIFTWINTNRKLSIREQSTQPKKLSKTQKKRVAIKKAVSEATNKRRLAYAMSVSIKKKGIKASHYFDKAQEVAFGKEFIEGLADIAAGSTIVLLKSAATELN